MRSSSHVQAGAGCGVVGGPVSQTEVFTNRDDDREADVSESYTGTAAGGSTVGASGATAVTTRAFASARDRAFRQVRLTSLHVVTMTNDSEVDCAMEVVGSSSGDAVLKVRQRGRIRIAWRATAGDIERINLTAPSGVARVDRDPAEPSGTVTVRVRRGSYTFAAAFRTSLRESQVPVGESDSAMASYSVEVAYLG